MANEDIGVSGTVNLSNSNAGDHNISKDSLTLSNGESGLAKNYSIKSVGVTIKKKPLKLSGSRKINRINRNIRLTSGQLRMDNQIKGDNVKLSGSTKTRVTKEGFNKIGTDGLKLTGTDASNYTLSGETHEFLFELRAKFKAIKNIENKINELAKSGKKIITGATQAVPKVVAMTAAPSLVLQREDLLLAVDLRGRRNFRWWSSGAPAQEVVTQGAENQALRSNFLTLFLKA